LAHKFAKKERKSMNLSTKIRGGILLANAFKEKGVEHVFTLAGGFCNPAS
jgi:acetolactate synthase-1/2/3 large subunit